MTKDKNQAGKGDTPRPCDKEAFDTGWERVFGKRPPSTLVERIREQFNSENSEESEVSNENTKS